MAYGLKASSCNPLMPPLAETPMKIGWLVPEKQAVESFAKEWKKSKFVLSIGYISKSVFASSDSFCLITLHIILAYLNTFSYPGA